MVNNSFAAEVWNTLSAINVNEHTETKGQGSYQLTYLSWAWAWGTLMERYPESHFTFPDEHKQEDGSVTVWCTVTVFLGEKQLSRDMWLPVMDHRNNAIKNPDARQISDARMRCLVKCLALFGLGHYIYAGEDIPQAEQEEAKEQSSQLLADWTIALDDCTSVDELRGKLVEAREACKGRPKDWAEIKRIGVIKKEELEKRNAD